MSIRTQFEDNIPEKTTVTYKAKIVDGAGAGLGPSALNSLTLTLYNEDDGMIINGRDNLNVMNSNGGILDSDGNFQMFFTSTDMKVVNQKSDFEIHVALFQWNYGVGKDGRHEAEFQVKNLNKVS